MENVENKISYLKSRLETKKEERTKAQANLEMYEKQLNEVTAQIKELGYNPEDLPQVIAELEKNISNNLAEAERILNEADGHTTEGFRMGMALS